MQSVGQSVGLSVGWSVGRSINQSICGAALQDGALNDEELNTFQVKCFNAPLQPEELLGVKKVVQEKMQHVRGRAVLHHTVAV